MREQEYRHLASNMRATAELISDPYEKRELLLIAQQYEVLADRSKRRAEIAEDTQKSA